MAPATRANEQPEPSLSRLAVAFLSRPPHGIVTWFAVIVGAASSPPPDRTRIAIISKGWRLNRRR